MPKSPCRARHVPKFKSIPFGTPYPQKSRPKTAVPKGTPFRTAESAPQLAHELARSALIRIPHPPGALAPAFAVQIPQPQGAPRHGVGNAVDPLPHRVPLILALGLNGLQPIACRASRPNRQPTPYVSSIRLWCRASRANRSLSSSSSQTRLSTCFNLSFVIVPYCTSCRADFPPYCRHRYALPRAPSFERVQTVM